MSEWIDINDIAKLSGKSIATIRRAIKKLSADSIKKDKGKHLYNQEVILRELGVDISSDTVMPESTIEHDTVIDTRLIDTMQAQINTQQRTIDQLLERLREANIIVNTYQQRQLAVQESTPVEPIADEKKKDPAWVGWLLVGILVALLGFATWINWRF